MSPLVEVHTKEKRLASKDVHTLYEVKQKRAVKLFSNGAARKLRKEENSDLVKKQLNNALDTVEV